MTTLVYSPPLRYIAQTTLPPACGCPACRSGLDTEQLLEMSNSAWLIDRFKIVDNVVVWDDRQSDDGQ